MKNIEVEVRSFISKEKYEELISFFKNNGILKKEDYQETYYFDSEEDLRIQKNNFFSKIILKKGKIHDDSREEIEIKIRNEDFENTEKFFLNLGYNINIKWFRDRYEFEWENITVCLDYTKGYGYIIEFEIMTEEQNKEGKYLELVNKMQQFQINITNKEEFEKKFKYYKENWKSLI